METETQTPAPVPEIQDPVQGTGADATTLDGTPALDGSVPDGAMDTIPTCMKNHIFYTFVSNNID